MVIAKVEKQNHQYDAFISYSRKDKAFAEKLEKTLENYKPPRDLSVPLRHLNVFRDEGDMTGTEYFKAIEEHVENSAKLIVVCSPNARNSKLVNDEIRRFAKIKGAENIIPLLLEGIPNNLAKPGQQDELAFPETLFEFMEMPLATSYLGFNPKKDKVNKGFFEGSWYSLLANIYTISRDEIEQRDKKRQVRRRRVATAIVSAVMIGLLSLTTFALIQRERAEENARRALEQRQRAEENEKTAQENARLAQEQQKIAEANAKEAQKQRRIAQEQRDAARKQLALNYWENGREALGEGEDLAFLHYCSQALRVSPNANLKKSIAQDVGQVTGNVALKNIFLNNASVRGATFAKDETSILTWSADSTARLWDAATGNHLATLQHDGVVVSATFSKDESRILTWSADSTTILWGVASGNQLTIFKHDGAVYGATFSKDEVRILTWSEDGTARLWDTATGKPLATLQHDGAVRSATLSKDESRILTWSDDGTARLWDARTGKQLATEFKHDGAVLGATFSKDESRILAWSEDGMARLWEAATGNQLASFKHDRVVRGATFSKDETRILTWSDDGTAKLWVVPGDLDFPFRQYVLQTQALTGTSFDPFSGRITVLSKDEWEAIRAKHLQVARAHARTCHYKRQNVYLRFWVETEKRSDHYTANE